MCFLPYAQNLSRRINWKLLTYVVFREKSCVAWRTEVESRLVTIFNCAFRILKYVRYLFKKENFNI